MTQTELLSGDLFYGLLDKYKLKMDEYGYRSTTTEEHLKIIRRVFKAVPYPDNYSVEKGNEWIIIQENRLNQGNICHHTFCCVTKAITVFNSYLEKRELIVTRQSRKKGKVPDCFSKIQFGYISSLPEKLDSKTIVAYEYYSRNFFVYLCNCNIREVKNLNVEVLLDYLEYAKEKTPNSMSRVIEHVRYLICYLQKNDLFQVSFNISFLKPGYLRKKVKPYFSYDEIQSLVAAIDNFTVLGKRDLAIVLIALYTGLRISDILSLKLDNIDWEDKTIHLFQVKTMREIIQPFPDEVGNAICDYVLNARPTSISRYIFLKDVAPHDRLVGTFVGKQILSRCMKSNPELEKQYGNKTFHAFRHSLASWLSMEQTPLPMISEILGHSNLESAKHYLSYNDKCMKSCCLGLDGIEVQKEELK